MRRARPVMEWLAEGEQIGLAKGERIGRLEFLEAAITSKFGQLSETVLEHLRQLPDDQLKALPKLLFSATTLADLGL